MMRQQSFQIEDSGYRVNVVVVGVCVFICITVKGFLYIVFIAFMNMMQSFVFIDVIASLEAEYYFWGVFRPVKSNQTLDKVGGEPSPFISSLERAPYDHASMDDSEAIDMEIDMVDGENVGRVDVVVSRDASKRLCGIP